MVPADVDPADWNGVLQTLWMRFDPSRHLTLLPLAPADTLDFTTPTLHVGSKVILNATDQPIRSNPAPVLPLTPVKIHPGVRDLRVLPGGHLVLQLHAAVDARRVLEAALAHPHVQDFLFIWAVSDDVPLDNDTLLLWGMFTRFDPARDWISRSSAWEGMRPVYRAPVGVNATWKPFYPAPLTMPEEVIRRAQTRLQAWGLK